MNRSFSTQTILAAVLLFAVSTEMTAVADQRVYRPSESKRFGFRVGLNAKAKMLSHSSATISFACEAESNLVRAIDLDGRIWQYSLDGTRRELIMETACQPSCATVHRGAKLLACAKPNGEVVMVDLIERQVRHSDSSRTDRITSLEFSADGKLLAGIDEDGLIRIWRIDSNEVARRYKVPANSLSSMSFSSDGNVLAVACFGTLVHVFDLASPDLERKSVSVPEGHVTCVQFLPDRKSIAVAKSDGSLLVVDPDESSDPINLPSYPFACWSVGFNDDGSQMVTGRQDGTVQLWDTQSWKRVQEVKSHQESVTKVDIHSQRGLIASGIDGRLVRWMADLPSIPATGAIEGVSSQVWTAVYSPDGKKLFVGGDRHRFELWETSPMRLTASINGSATIRCAAFSPDGKWLVVGTSDKEVLVCDSHSGETINTLRGHRGLISAVLFVDDTVLVSACDRGWVKRWDLSNSRELFSKKVHRRQIYCAAISPDGKWLVTGGGFWLGSDPGEIVVWDLADMSVKTKLEGHELSVWSLAFFPDGRRLAASDSKGLVKIWDLERGRLERDLRHATWVRAITVAKDGSTLAVGRGDGSIRLWDTETWKQFASFDGHEKFAFSLLETPDEKGVVTASDDGSVRFWDWPTRN